MIYKWNELDFHHFEEFLKAFENKEEWTKKVILELQDPYSILFGKPRRVFIGYGINVEDYAQYNERFLKLVNIFKSGIPDFDMLGKDSISICCLTKDGPCITPLVGGQLNGGSFGIMRNFLFGEKSKEADLINSIFPEQSNSGPGIWYQKNEGKRVVWIPQKEGVSAKERFVRFRTIDLNDWKRLVDEWMVGVCEEISEGDLKKEDFEIQPEESKIIFNTINDYGFDKIFGDRD